MKSKNIKKTAPVLEEDRKDGIVSYNNLIISNLHS